MANIDEVVDALRASGFVVESVERLRNDQGHQVKVERIRAFVNVFDNGTVQVQGREKEIVEPTIDQLRSGNPKRATAPTKVFVAYGHDKEARDQLEAMLRRWNLEPLILDQLPSEGQTLIEKIERYVKDNEVKFGIVLATPDDEGYPAGKETEKAFRARQNVVLELGMLLAHLGRPKVAILLRNASEMERPSDIQGLIYLPFTGDAGEQAVPLAKEMIKQGYRIELERL